MNGCDRYRRIARQLAFLSGLAVLGAGAAAVASQENPKIEAMHEHPQEGDKKFRISTVSSRNDAVTGGDALVRVDVDGSVALSSVRVTLNDRDVTASFSAVAGHSLLGVVSGFDVGDKNVLTAQANGKGPKGRLQVTNYPLAGPVISGRHETPFFCTTSTFPIPVVGGVLGPPLDADCSIVTRVDYIYRSTAAGNPFKRLNTSAPMPSDVASTTTNAGVTVPFIVRMEHGTINRSIYQITILHNPYAEAAPTFLRRSAGWNGKLIYTHGGGCRAGWYSQGLSTGGVVDAFMLGQGYAVASASLNVFGNNCNDLLTAETTIMVKERFIEEYGSPRFTIAWGSSGGSYQSHQTTDNYPGIFNGLVIGHTFPDVTSATLTTLFDSRLLQHYFNVVAPGLFTMEQQRLTAGFGQFGEIANLDDNAKRLDPAAEFPAIVPISARYNALTNPTGARGDVYDHTVNVYGLIPHTLFARRPTDNVGVQYGLAALKAGQISIAQFLDINARIGGLDVDAQPQTARTVFDRDATRRAYESGRITNAGGGLASVPIIDSRGYTDNIPTGDIHMRVHQFSQRARLLAANGDSANQVLWVGTGAVLDLDSSKPPLQDAIRQMDKWLETVLADNGDDSLGVKVRRDKPADLLDACFAADGTKIVQPQTLNGNDVCARMYPTFLGPRISAGAPLTDDVIKCHLKGLDPRDYAVQFTNAQWDQLKNIFPQGVCDFSKQGEEQRPLKGTWLRVVTDD